MSNAGKIRVPVVDKNGKQTHVWKTQAEIDADAQRTAISAPAPKASSVIRDVAPVEDEGSSFTAMGVAENPFAGSSEWKDAISVRDLFSDEYPISEKAELIADRITDSSWYADSLAAADGSDDFELGEALENLREAGEIGSQAVFDQAWNNIYNIADNDKIWLDAV